MIQQHYSEPYKDQLKAALLTYAQEQLPLEARISRLGEEFQYCIRYVSANLGLRLSVILLTYQ